jgi:hypothetical protein
MEAERSDGPKLLIIFGAIIAVLVVAGLGALKIGAARWERYRCESRLTSLVTEHEPERDPSVESCRLTGNGDEAWCFVRTLRSDGNYRVEAVPVSCSSDGLLRTVVPGTTVPPATP